MKIQARFDIINAVELLEQLFAVVTTFKQNVEKNKS